MLNQCMFIGNLGRDPEVRYTGEGKAIANINLAVTEKRKSGEHTEWVRITTFDKLAEICSEYLKKGSKAFFSGRMQTRTYEKDGETKYTVEIIADKMVMLDRPSHSDGEKQQRPPTEKGQSEFDDMEDDIPF